MSGVLTAPCLRQNLSAKLSQSKRIIQFPIREQTGIRRNVAAMEFQLQAPVEIDPERLEFHFTHRVRHDRASNIATRY